MAPVAAAAMVMVAATLVLGILVGSVGGMVTALVKIPLAWGALIALGAYLAVASLDGPMQFSFAPIGLFPLILTFLVAALTTVQLQTRLGLRRKWAAPAGLVSALAVGFLYGLPMRFGNWTLAKPPAAYLTAGLALGVVVILFVLWIQKRKQALH